MKWVTIKIERESSVHADAYSWEFGTFPEHKADAAIGRAKQYAAALDRQYSQLPRHEVVVTEIGE